MRYRKELDTARSHINTLRAVIAVVLAIAAAMWWGWQTAPERLQVHVPPELRTGGVLDADEVHPASIYTFALYMWQQAYRWDDDGREDYPENLRQLQAFMTPSMQQMMQEDFQRRDDEGELARTRAIREAPGRRYERERVEALGDDTWIVWIDVEIEEHVDGELVKHLRARYPLRVVRYDVDPQYNPWGLALDGFAGQPTQIDLEEQ